VNCIYTISILPQMVTCGLWWY